MAKLTRIGLSKMENDGVGAGFVKEMKCKWCAESSNERPLFLVFTRGEVKGFCVEHYKMVT